MEIVLITNILAVLFAFLESKKLLKNGLLFSFVIIFIFLSLRFDYGNDYFGYYKGFQEINRFVNFDLFDKELHYEPGWIVLCILFKQLGFFWMVAFLSFLYCYILYKLIKKYVPLKLYWLSVFICVFSIGNLLTQLSSMRQTLAILIFIISIKFINEKRIIIFIALILLASTIHNSALLLLPIYFIQFVNFKFNKFSGGLILLLYCSLYVFGENIRPLLNSLVASFNEDYLVYDEKGVLNSGIGLFVLSFFFILVLMKDRQYDGEKALLFKLVTLGFLFAPIGLIIMMFGRVSMYFSVFLIVVYPLVFDSIKSKEIRLAFLVLLVLIIMSSFFDFFESPIWQDKYKEYHTIFSVN